MFRQLADPGRLRVLALVAETELTVGELAAVLDDSQPNVSRQVSALRQGGLLLDRRQGTRTFVRLADSARQDLVVRDALEAGRQLCTNEGCFDRVEAVVRRRQSIRGGLEEPSWPMIESAPEVPVYALALAASSVPRGVAVDAATGDGGFLDLLAPFFQRVIAVDRSASMLERAAVRVQQRGYDNVELICGELDDPNLRRSVGAGAQAVFASKYLQTEQSPRAAMLALAELLEPGGELHVIEHQICDDRQVGSNRGVQGGGFSREDLSSVARSVGLVQPICIHVPPGFVGYANDSPLSWLLMRATRPAGPSQPEPSA